MAAAVLDIVVMGLPLYLLLSVIFDFESLSQIFTESRRGTEGLTAADAFSFSDYLSLANGLNLILLAAITILLWVNWDGRTPGKKLMKVRIVSYPDYQPFSYGRAAVRTLISLIASVTVVGLRSDRPDGRQPRRQTRLPRYRGQDLRYPRLDTGVSAALVF